MSINVTNGEINRIGDPKLLSLLSDNGWDDIIFNPKNITNGTGGESTQFNLFNFIFNIFDEEFDINNLKSPYLTEGLNFVYRGDKVYYSENEIELNFINGLLFGPDPSIGGGGNYTLKNFLSDYPVFSEILNIPGFSYTYDYTTFEKTDIEENVIEYYSHSLYFNISPVFLYETFSEGGFDGPMGPILILINLNEDATTWEDVNIDIRELSYGFVPAAGTP